MIHIIIIAVIVSCNFGMGPNRCCMKRAVAEEDFDHFDKNTRILSVCLFAKFSNGYGTSVLAARR
jgi:hypothetical protein